MSIVIYPVTDLKSALTVGDIGVTFQSNSEPLIKLVVVILYLIVCPSFNEVIGVTKVIVLGLIVTDELV